MSGEKKGAMGSVEDFFSSPLRSGYPRTLSVPEDYAAVAGIVVFTIAAFALPWINVSFRLLGQDIYSQRFNLFVSPWAWLMIVVLLAMIAGLWFVQARGWIFIGTGIYCLVFNVIFYIGAWLKVRAIIGDVVELARGIPFIGKILGDLIQDITKKNLNVDVTWGFYLLIPAGVLLIVAGVLRLRRKKAGVVENGTAEVVGPAEAPGAGG